MKYYVGWIINGVRGEGEASLPYATVKAWIVALNKTYGARSHFFVVK